MPKQKYLNDAEKIQINLYHKEGYSNREIGRRIGRSETVVRSFLKKRENYGVKKPTRGNRKLNIRQINQIRNEATTNFLNSTQIKEKLDLPVTTRHIAHILRNSENVKWKKPVSKPVLKPHHKIARLDFAKKHMQWSTEWDNVVFSDEKKFNLDGPDSYSCYWHDLRNNDVRMSKRNFGGGSVMVWVAFSSRGKSKICFVPPKMNSKIYTELLDDALISFLDDKMDEDCIFQQDNAAIHVSKESLKWFEERNIRVMKWPACSPDLNPVENLWGCMSRKIYGQKAQGHLYKTVSELKFAIKEAWKDLDSQLLENLVKSMPHRIFEIINKNGGPISY